MEVVPKEGDQNDWSLTTNLSVYVDSLSRFSIVPDA